MGEISVLIVLFLAGCKKDERVEFIQGVWYNKNAHLANIPAESAQESNWEFDNRYFSFSSCCIVESYFSGNYSITDKKENELTLDLYSMKGQIGGNTLRRSDALTLVIKINPEADTITINGDGPYTRVSR